MSQWAMALLLVAVLCVPAAVATQVAPRQQPAFDVVSLRESKSLELDGTIQNTPGRFRVNNLSVRWILRCAFRMRDYQIIGAPAWTEARYQRPPSPRLRRRLARYCARPANRA